VNFLAPILLPNRTVDANQFPMLSRILFESDLPSHLPAIVTMHQSTSWAKLKEMAEAIYFELRCLANRRIGLRFHSVAMTYAILAAADKLGCDLFLLDPLLPPDEIRRLASEFRLGAVIGASANGSPAQLEILEQPGEAPWSGESTVTVLTSGTTGEPKAATHTWESLSRPVRFASEIKHPRWLLTYRPHLYAGLQVMLQCFANLGTLINADADMAPRALAEFLAQEHVQFVSATPSFWKRLLFSVDSMALEKIPLVQITLGGEVVEQWVLDALQERFPNARLVHIYATTELGRCFSVSDGRAGFPVRYLHQSTAERAEMRISDSELLVRSLNSMRSYDSYSGHEFHNADWFRTGDLVEIKEDRVHFIGRKSDVINVGGSKVHPLEIERVIRQIPGVYDVRVFAKSSSVVGQLVACEIVPGREHDPQQLKESIRRMCLSRLSPFQQPRLIRMVEQIEMTAACKTPRAAAG
jgi:acyl-CoA synthetase (AMP-forming)/AMP-acid ligase II